MKSFFRNNRGKFIAFLSITLGCLIYTFFAFAFFSNDAGWLKTAFANAADTQQKMMCVGSIFVIVGLCSLLSPLIYLNVTKWMWPQFHSFLQLYLGWLPFLRRFDPNCEYEREDRESAIAEVKHFNATRTPDYQWMPSGLYDNNGKELWDLEDLNPEESVLLTVLGRLAVHILRRIFLGAWSLFSAIALPLLAPLLVLLVLAVINSLINQAGYMLLIGGGLSLITVFYIVATVLSFTLKETFIHTTENI